MSNWARLIYIKCTPSNRNGIWTHLHCIFSKIRIRHLEQTQLAARLNSTSKVSKAVQQLSFPLPPFSLVGGVCRLSKDSSLRRCRTPDGKICSGRGRCECGICLCMAAEPGKFFGPRCECHDWVCATFNGKACNGAYSGTQNDSLYKDVSQNVTF